MAYTLSRANEQAVVEIKSTFQSLCAAAYENAVFCDRGKRGLLFFHTWTVNGKRGPERGLLFFHTWTAWTVDFQKEKFIVIISFKEFTVHAVHV